MTAAIRNAAANAAADADTLETWSQAMTDVADRIETVPSAAVKTTPYTIVDGDAGTCIEADGVTVSVPADATYDHPVGAVVEVYQVDSDTVTVAPASGVTLRSPVAQTGSRDLSGAYATAVLRKRGVDEWVLSGELAAVA